MTISIIYFLAGLSERFGGKPKGLARVGKNNEPLMEISLKQTLESKFEKIIFVVGKQTHALYYNVFGKSYTNIPIFYALQEFNPEERDKPWGTCDALCSASHFVDGPFVVCNGDDLYGKESFKTLTNHLEKEKGGAAIGYELGNVISEDGAVNRGIYKIHGDYALSIEEVLGIEKSKLDEKNLNENTLCSMNIFGFQKETINELNKSLKEFKEKNARDRRIECLLPVEISNLIKLIKLNLKIYPTN